MKEENGPEGREDREPGEVRLVLMLVIAFGSLLTALGMAQLPVLFGQVAWVALAVGVVAMFMIARELFRASLDAIRDKPGEARTLPAEEPPIGEAGTSEAAS